MAGNIGELFISIKADVEQLKKDINDTKAYLTKEGKLAENSWKFKTQFDNSLAKLRVSELKTLRDKLERQYAKKIRLDADVASINRTKQQIASVKEQLASITDKPAIGIGKGFLGGLIATSGVITLIRGLKEATDAALKQKEAEIQVEQAIKQTGNASGYTAKELFKLASGLQKLTGVGDEDILKNVTNQLLTFTNISGDAFKRAQKSILDLNAVIAGGNVESLTSQAIQLGKALENPIQGISALTRVGVTFTEAQKKIIEQFVKQNDLASAQRVILDEIEAKYGGQAEALNKATGGIKGFQAAVGDLMEKIGAPLLDIFSKIATELTKVIDTFQVSEVTFDELKNKVDTLNSTLPDLLSRYDTLKSKTKLSREEQDELKNVILKIAEQIPSAITSFNQYGEALDINKDKVKKYTEELQKELLVVNQKEIQSYQKRKERLEQERKLLESQLKRMIESGKKKITISTAAGVIETEVKVSDKDIIDLQQSIKQLGLEIDGVNNRIKTLKGEPLINNNQITQIENLNKSIKQLSLKDLGYSPEQVAQFEKLKFALDGYIEYRQKLIEMEYKNEVALAENNADKIEEAEFNKNKKLAELNYEYTEYQNQLNKSKVVSYEESVGEIEKLNEQHLKELEKQQYEYEANKQKAIDDYYNQTRTIDESYFDWKLNKIKEETENLYLQTGNQLIAKQYEIEQLKALEQEYFDWRWSELTNIFTGTGALLSIELAGIEAAYDTFWQSLTDSTITGKQRLEQIWQSFKASVIGMLGDILKQYITNAIAQLLFADTMRTAEIAKGIATGTALASAYAPAAINASIMTFGSAAGIGLAAYQAALSTSLASSAMGAIPKFAQGGEMIVPPGYPNDSFPALFSSGEKISVTRASQVGKDIELLYQIDNSIKALTKTLYAKNMTTIVNANIDSLRFTESEIVPAIQTINRQGIKI